jgi:multimeric flavodoxin WrbA
MKALVVQGSGRSRGNTARLDTLLEASLAAEAAAAGVALQVERITLADADVRLCRGCRSCFDKGESTCPLRDDDVLSMKAKMQDADLLVLSGPVYVNDVSGAMKNWIDRLAFLCHRPAFAGKTAFLLATTGSTPARHALRTMQVALWTWGYRVAASATFAAGASTGDAELRSRYEGQLRRIAARLVREVRLRRSLRPGFLSLMVFRIQQSGWRKAAPDSLDHAYWEGKGWLDTRRCTYFFPHKTNPLTTAGARLIGSLVGAFMS